MGVRARGQVPSSSPANRGQKRHRRLLYLSGALVFSTLIALQLAALKALPYSTSLLEDVSPNEAVTQSQHPEGGFNIGPLRWDIPSYVTDPRLEPFRRYFYENCDGQTGVTAALCLSDKFAEQFPFGEPLDDFFKADYDPAASLVAHTQKGEPGHCVTRSGLVAATLLAVGIPACVVQLVPRHAPGHNIFSVWDESYGWVAIDPSNGYMIGDKRGPSSAIEALQSPEAVKSYRLGEEPKASKSLNIVYEGEGASLFRGHLIYPEPWLYLRTGVRAANWPFRGVFVHIGPWQWWVGPAQRLLRYGVAICSLLTVLLFCLSLTGGWVQGSKRWKQIYLSLRKAA